MLECGTGFSTVVRAHALREDALREGVPGRVTSMQGEDQKPWFELAASLLPDPLPELPRST